MPIHNIEPFICLCVIEIIRRFLSETIITNIVPLKLIKTFDRFNRVFFNTYIIPCLLWSQLWLIHDSQFWEKQIAARTKLIYSMVYEIVPPIINEETFKTWINYQNPWWKHSSISVITNFNDSLLNTTKNQIVNRNYSSPLETTIASLIHLVPESIDEHKLKEQLSNELIKTKNQYSCINTLSQTIWSTLPYFSSKVSSILLSQCNKYWKELHESIISIVKEQILSIFNEPSRVIVQRLGQQIRMWPSEDASNFSKFVYLFIKLSCKYFYHPNVWEKVLDFFGISDIIKEKNQDLNTFSVYVSNNIRDSSHKLVWMFLCWLKERLTFFKVTINFEQKDNEHFLNNLKTLSFHLQPPTPFLWINCEESVPCQEDFFMLCQWMQYCHKKWFVTEECNLILFSQIFMKFLLPPTTKPGFIKDKFIKNPVHWIPLIISIKSNSSDILNRALDRALVEAQSYTVDHLNQQVDFLKGILK